VWEDAVDRGYVTREAVKGHGTMVTTTALGRTFLRENGRAAPAEDATGT
jgi:hypothetical protein